MVQSKHDFTRNLFEEMDSYSGKVNKYWCPISTFLVHIGNSLNKCAYKYTFIGSNVIIKDMTGWNEGTIFHPLDTSLKEVKITALRPRVDICMTNLIWGTNHQYDTRLMFIQNFITKTLHNAKLRIKKKIHFKVNYRRNLVVKPQWKDEHTHHH